MNKSIFSSTIFTVGASTILVFGVATIFFKTVGPIPLSISQTTTNKESAFQVSGEGKTSITPDEAQVSVGISSNKPSIKLAQDEANKTINQITESIKKLGVEDKDIKTTNYSVYPNYDYNSGSQRINGYNVSAQLTVKVRDFDMINSIIDQSTALGANQVGGITFMLSDDKQKQAEKEARELAVKEAKEKAEALASASGIKLGRIINVSESTSGFPVPMYARDAVMNLESGKAAGAPTQVEPGSSDVSINVTLSYETL